MNQELFKLESAVNRAAGAWDRQMKRDGHLKKESRDISTADPKRMSPTAAAFFHEYQDSKVKLDNEATRANLFGGTPANPADLTAPKNDGQDGGTGGEPELPKGKAPKAPKEPKAPKTKPPKLTLVNTEYPDPSKVVTPADIARKIIAPALYAPMVKAEVEGLAGKKPWAKVYELDGQHFVVTAVNTEYVTVNRVLPLDGYQGNTFDDPSQIDGENWEGLTIRTTKSAKAASFVMLSALESLCCIPGDPLASVALTGTESE